MDGNATVVTAWRCLECEAVSEEPAEGSLYECSRCGEVFTQDGSADGASNRCPNCNIFGGKLADDACPECNAAEVEQVQAVDLDGELVVVDDADGLNENELVVKAVAAREAAQQAEREEAEAREARDAEAREKFDALPRVRADEVLPGDVLAYLDPGWYWEPYREFKVGRVGPEETEPGKLRISPPGGIGFSYICDPGDMFALASRPEVTPENEPSLEEQLRGHFLDQPVSHVPEGWDR